MPERDHTAVVYALDDNYAMQAGVSLVSLFENNRNLCFYVFLLSDHLSDINRSRLKETVEGYGNTIEFIEVYDIEKRVGVRLSLNNWGKMAYCRLFLPELVPEWVDKLIYIDADTLVLGSISHLAEILDSEGFSSYYAAGCRDSSSMYKKLHGFRKSETYYNSGVLLINLKLWRLNGIQSAFILEIRRRNGRSIDPDQSYINCLMINKIMMLPAKYNVMSLYYLDHDDYLRISDYSENEAYSEEELAEAVAAPVIVHFAGDRRYRPWYAGCRHCLKETWLEYLRKTEWKEFIPEEKAPEEELSLAKKCKKAVVRRAVRYRFLAACYVRYRYGFKAVLYRRGWSYGS